MVFRDVKKALKKGGFVPIRVCGSHYMFEKDGHTIPVPFHRGRELPIGLLKALEKETGLTLRR